jgi:hypothetical protein
MKTIKFNLVTHGKDAAKLLESRSMDLRLLNHLPEHGLISFEHGEVIAMGFLRRMEGPYVIYDSFITSPTSTSEQRDRALGVITNKLEDWCKETNVSKLIAFTVDRGLNKRLITKLGFELDQDMRFFHKTLNYLD